MMDRAESLVRDNPFLELRLDYVSQPLAALPKLKNLPGVHPEATFVATCRRAVNGGKFKGSVAAELSVLRKAAECGFPLVDLELQSAAALKATELRDLYDRVGIILSHHNFKSTKNLDEQFAEMSQYPADFYKLVSTATNLYDNVVMMKFLEKTSGKHEMVGLCMGEPGHHQPSAGVRAGSVFTFGAAVKGEETAPGQITASELRDIYRIEMIDQATQVYGVVGDPISHSLSPVMMNAAFRRETVNAVYLALHAKNLKDVLACVKDTPMRGLSVTMPYKQEILSALENSDPLTKQIGACNTVVRAADGKLYGFNTDVAGMVSPLEQRLPLNGARILIVGAGGAARAAAFGLNQQRRTGVHHQSHAGEGAGVGAAGQGKISEARRRCQAGVRRHHQCDPGRYGRHKQSPLEEKELNTKFLFDLVYSPAETKLMSMARAKNIQVIPGLEMFVQQGARQFEIWAGKPAPMAEMGYVVSKALQRRAEEAAAEEQKAPAKKTTAKKATKKVAKVVRKK